MGYHEPDVYNQPEKFGLTIVYILELSEPCYSFDMLVIWSHVDSGYYWGTDAGCSCAAPFEADTELNDITPFVYAEIKAYLRGRIGAYKSNVTNDTIDGILYDIRKVTA